MVLLLKKKHQNDPLGVHSGKKKTIASLYFGLPRRGAPFCCKQNEPSIQKKKALISSRHCLVPPLQHSVLLLPPLNLLLPKDTTCHPHPRNASPSPPDLRTWLYIQKEKHFYIFNWYSENSEPSPRSWGVCLQKAFIYIYIYKRKNVFFLSTNVPGMDE